MGDNGIVGTCDWECGDGAKYVLDLAHPHSSEEKRSCISPYDADWLIAPFSTIN
jgi:hypothetical protein